MLIFLLALAVVLLGLAVVLAGDVARFLAIAGTVLGGVVLVLALMRVV
jgi:hypothetical protein